MQTHYMAMLLAMLLTGDMTLIIAIVDRICTSYPPIAKVSFVCHTY